MTPPPRWAEVAMVCATVAAVGLYACTLWERSLRLRQHQIYIESAVTLIDVVMNGSRREGAGPSPRRPPPLGGSAR